MEAEAVYSPEELAANLNPLHEMQGVTTFPPRLPKAALVTQSQHVILLAKQRLLNGGVPLPARQQQRGLPATPTICPGTVQLRLRPGLMWPLPANPEQTLTIGTQPWRTVKIIPGNQHPRRAGFRRIQGN